MATESEVFDAKDVVAALDALIKKLEVSQQKIADASAKIGSAQNTLALERVTSSLNAARIGLTSLKNGCCSQNCKYEYEAPPAPAV